LEDRQNRSFIEELSAAKEIAQLQSQVIRLQGELKATERESDMSKAETVREVAKLDSEFKATLQHVVYASALAVVTTTVLAGMAVWRK
jgi:hypothetical protein